jgi:hypothetical protein
MKFEIPEVSSAHRQAISQALDTYDEVSRLNAAIDKQNQKVADATAAREVAARALSANDTELALAISDTASLPIEKEGKRLTAALAKATANVERQVRVAAALSGRLDQAEAILESERLILQNLVRDHATEVRRFYAEQLVAAVQPMIHVLRQLALAGSATGTGIAQELNDIVVPDLRDPGTVYLLNGSVMRGVVDGEWVSLLDIGSEPQLAELVRVVHEPRAALIKVEAYVSRVGRRQAEARAQMFTQRGYGSQLHD